MSLVLSSTKVTPDLKSFLPSTSLSTMALLAIFPDNRVLVAVTSSFVLYILVRKIRARKQLPLPPGPNRLPIIGSVHNIPSEYPWIAFKKMADEQYGTSGFFYALDVLS